MADCVLLVIEAGRSRKEDVAKALELIPRDKLTGIVLNKQDSVKTNGRKTLFPV